MNCSPRTQSTISILVIHSKLDNLAFTLPIDPHDSGADVQPSVAQLNAFTALSEDDVRQLIHNSSKNHAV